MPHPVLAVDCCEFFAEPGGLVAPVQWTADIGRNKPGEEFYWSAQNRAAQVVL